MAPEHSSSTSSSSGSQTNPTNLMNRIVSVLRTVNKQIQNKTVSQDVFGSEDIPSLVQEIETYTKTLSSKAAS